MNNEIYLDNGHDNRADYLEFLCESYHPDIVYSLAELLGPTEDFDGLIASLQDTV